MNERERINKELDKLVSDKTLVTQTIQSYDKELQDLERRKAKLIDLPSEDLGGAIEDIRSMWESINRLRADALKQLDNFNQREKSNRSELARLDILWSILEFKLKQDLIMAKCVEFNKLSEALAIKKAEIMSLQPFTDHPNTDKTKVWNRDETLVRNSPIPESALVSQQEPVWIGDKWQTRKE